MNKNFEFCKTHNHYHYTIIQIELIELNCLFFFLIFTFKISFIINNAVAFFKYGLVPK